MAKQAPIALREPAEWLGDWHPLAEQLGSTDGLLELGSVSAFLRLGPLHDRPALREFLKNYQARILLPLELPAIRCAHAHAARQQTRELVALDRQLAAEPALQSFAAGSRRVGRCQLQKLRPLRDQRLVQRYLDAVEAGQAHGWHTLVYGLTLAIYSLPLRQGLLGYAHQTTLGFIYSASRTLRLSERQCRALFDDLCARLPADVEALLGHSAAPLWPPT